MSNLQNTCSMADYSRENLDRHLKIYLKKIIANNGLKKIPGSKKNEIIEI